MKFLIICLLASLNLCVIIDGVKLDCDFELWSKGYVCKVKELKITSKYDRVITEVTGDHKDGKSNADVMQIHSDQHVVKYFPLDLAKYFKNINNVFINGSSMVEINAEDLQQFGSQIREFSIQHGNLKVLEAGLFATMPNLVEISFASNHIRHVGEGVFTNLKKLNKIWFRYNSCYSDSSIDGNTTTAMNLSIDIEKKCKNPSQVAQNCQNELRDVHSMMEAIMAKLTKLENGRLP